MRITTLHKYCDFLFGEIESKCNKISRTNHKIVCFEDLNNGEIRHTINRVQPYAISSLNLRKTLCNEGTILVPRFSKFCKLSYLTSPSYIHRDIVAIKSKNEFLLNKFLFFFLFANKGLLYSIENNKANIIDKVLNLPFPLLSIEKQKEIIKRIRPVYKNILLARKSYNELWDKCFITFNNINFYYQDLKIPFNKSFNVATKKNIFDEKVDSEDILLIDECNETLFDNAKLFIHFYKASSDNPKIVYNEKNNSLKHLTQNFSTTSDFLVFDDKNGNTTLQYFILKKILLEFPEKKIFDLPYIKIDDNQAQKFIKTISNDLSRIIELEQEFLALFKLLPTLFNQIILESFGGF